MRARVASASLRLDDRAALERELGLAPDASDAALVLAGYERWGRGLAARLEGDFAYDVIDEEKGERHLGRDAFGVTPLVFARTETPSRALDAETVVSWLLGGDHRAMESTFLRDVARVPPGHVLVVSRSGVARHRWFEPPAEERIAAADCDREVQRLLERAVRVRLDPEKRTIVQVSGGLDSSSVACLADRLGADALLVSAAYPGLPCDEARWQAAVAQRVSLEHERWDATAVSPLEPFAEDSPFRPAQPDPTAGWRAIAAREGARVVLTGAGGDQLFFERGAFRDLAAKGRLLALAREAKLAPRYSSRTSASILRDALTVLVPPFVKRLRARRRRRPEPPPWLGPRGREAFLALREPPAPEGDFASHTQLWTWRWLNDPALVWYLELSGALAARHGLELRHPFLDARLARFVLSLPPERRRPRGLMKRLLRTALAGVLPDAIRARRGITVFDSFMELQGRHALPRARALLASGEWASAEWVDRGAFAALLARFEARPSAEDARLIWDALNLEEWLRSRT